MSRQIIERRGIHTNVTRGAAGHAAVRVLLDFDGTVTLADTVDCLLDEFASAAWLDIERAWEAGHIGSRVCLAQQTALLRATPQAFDALIDAIPIDPGFTTLVRRCRDLGVELLIVSDGYDRAIRRVLERASVALPFVANVLHPVGRDEWRLTSPAFKASCRVAAGHCKCARASEASAVVLIGDGRSDFCVAHAAHFTLAKPRLARYCEQRHLPNAAIKDLADAADRLEMWMSTRARAREPALAAGEIA